MKKEELTETEKVLVAVLAYDAVATGRVDEGGAFVAYAVMKLGVQWNTPYRMRYLEQEYYKQKHGFESNF